MASALDVSGLTVGEILEACPGVMEVLEEFGIRLDPWTIIALGSSLEQLAEYSALPDPGEFRREVVTRLAAQGAGDAMAARPEQAPRPASRHDRS